MTKKHPRGRTLSRTKSASSKKRNLEYLMVAAAVLIVIGLTVLQTGVVRLGPDVPISHSILVFALININIIFLFFLLILILRNLYKVFFEQRQVAGAQLRTKLVVAFISLSLVPAALLFYTAMRFITTGHDYWFGAYVEQSLMESLDLAEYSRQVHERRVVEFGQTIANRLNQSAILTSDSLPRLKEFLDSARRDYGLSVLEVYAPNLVREAASMAADFTPNSVQNLPREFFRMSETRRPPEVRMDPDPYGDIVRAVWPLSTGSSGTQGYLVAGFRSHMPLQERIQTVSRSLDEYRQLKRLHEPIRFSHYIALTIVALISVFISTWIGLHLAKQITGPIMDLAEGTNRIAEGDYDFTIDVQSRPDEVGTLVSSFNRMTKDLKAHKSELTLKNQELLGINVELDQRRRYMEIILQNVAAGVVSADAKGVITTINHSAEEIFKIPAARIIGKPFEQVMSPQQKAILDEMIQAAKNSPRGSGEKHIRMRIAGRGLSLHIHLTLLRDESGQDLGLVIVFDDLYELEKAQRVAVWREVARRIAHEIKNPLTPIQLSAQRLRKRYERQLGDDGKLLDECTDMIIRQVDELKRLVNEFSNFARMPEAAPTPNNLSDIVDETMVMYTGAHRDISFVVQKDNDIPVFNLDREQLKRALINLLDNAVAAVNGKGTIEVSLTYDKMLRMVRLQVADDGVGINPADRGRLFEPYFSTKKAGTGLGLAIVRTIVTDHDGFVRFQNNAPKGTRFIIELPVKLA